MSYYFLGGHHYSQINPEQLSRNLSWNWFKHLLSSIFSIFSYFFLLFSSFFSCGWREFQKSCLEWKHEFLGVDFFFSSIQKLSSFLSECTIKYQKFLSKPELGSISCLYSVKECTHSELWNCKKKLSSISSHWQSLLGKVIVEDISKKRSSLKEKQKKVSYNKRESKRKKKKRKAVVRPFRRE